MNRLLQCGTQYLRRIVPGLLLAAQATADIGSAVGVPHPQGPWTFAAGTAAPWTATGTPASGPVLGGQSLWFGPERVSGPAPFACAQVRYSFVVSPAEGLFQGALPAPADVSARALGVPALPLATLRVDCDSGSFDFHHIADDTLLTALDGMIWTLHTDAPAAGPEAVVQRLYRHHLTHDMAFTPHVTRDRYPWLSAVLAARIESYFDDIAGTGETPPVNGDPFTDSQEPFSGFVTGAAMPEAGAMRVPVHLGDAGRTRTVQVLLIPDGDTWRVDDLMYEDGVRLRDVLIGP